LDLDQIGPALGARLGRYAHALSRDDEVTEIVEEARELRVLRRLGDRKMEGEILLDGAVAVRDRRLDRGEAAGDAPARGGRPPGGGEARRLGLDADAQLHHVEHLGDRGETGLRETE